MALAAAGWGLIAGLAVLLGALAAWFLRPSPRVIAGFMALASGILLSVAAFELLDEAFARGGFWPAAAGYAAGALLFGVGLLALDRSGARHRKRSRHALEVGRDASGVVALATVLDSVPEALIIGMNFHAGERLGIATVAAVFLANMPESLSSSTRMKAQGHGPAYVFGVWFAVAIVTGLASLAGYSLLGDLRPEGVSVIQAVAGGAFLVFIVDVMVPESVAEDREAAGIIAAFGFLVGFGLSRGLG